MTRYSTHLSERRHTSLCANAVQTEVYSITIQAGPGQPAQICFHIPSHRNTAIADFRLASKMSRDNRPMIRQFCVEDIQVFTYHWEDSCKHLDLLRAWRWVMDPVEMH